MRLGVYILVGFTALACACGKGERLDESGERLRLARQDVAAILTIDPKGGEAVDRKFHGAYSAVFGGKTGADVFRYYQERVRHLVDPQKLQISPNHFKNENWLKQREGAKAGGASQAAAAAQGEGVVQGASTVQGGVAAETEGDNKRFYEGARNIGVVYWLEGLVNQTPVVLTLDNGNKLPIDSSRAGVVTLGEGYRKTQPDTNGTQLPLPAAFRQAILLHEARHSDCTGGITESELHTIRQARDTVEYDQAFRTMPCGHLHQICQGGDLDGLPACDNEAWGAYAIGAIYALGALETATTGQDRAILQSLYQDQIHRLQVDVEKLFLGKLGKPDMSHQGVVGAR